MLAFIKFVYTFLFYFVYIELLLLYDLSHVNTNGCVIVCTVGVKRVLMAQNKPTELLIFLIFILLINNYNH